MPQHGMSELERRVFLAGPPKCAKWLPTSNPERIEAVREAAALLRGEVQAAGYLARWQRFLCAICGRKRMLVLDHDHKSGLVRAWLCESCNRGEGNAKTARVYLEFRERHPTAILGVQIRYPQHWSKRGIAVTPKRLAEAHQALADAHSMASESMRTGRPVTAELVEALQRFGAVLGA
ncbi:endonuclease domain-containing protein [Kitasatospora sp. NPDC001574]